MIPLFLLTIPISSAQISEPCALGRIEVLNSICINPAELFPPNPSISTPFCISGWTYSSSSNKCYRVFPIQLSSYKVAKEFCSSFNSSLVTITSEEDQSVIYEISTRGWHPDFENENGDFAWMGLSKRKRFHWLWETGKPLGAEIWAKGSSEEVGKIWERMCAVYDPTAMTENEIRGAMKPIECEGSEQEVGNVFCEQDSISVNVANTTNYCEKGWYYYTESELCYKVLQGHFSSDERKEECNRHKSELVNLKSPEEMQFISNLITSGWRLPQRQTSKNLIWIGPVLSNNFPSIVIRKQGPDVCFTLDPQAVIYLNGKTYLGEIGTENCDSNRTHFVCSKQRLETEETNFAPINSKILLVSIILLVIAVIFVISAFLAFLLYRKQVRRRRGQLTALNTFSRFAKSTSTVEAYPLLEIGNSFDLEDFKFTETIGSGHFGCVFAAEFHLNGTIVKVAVKRCRLSGDQEHLRSLSSELAAMSKLPPHPNVVTLIGSVTTELKKSGQLYTVMELCEHKSLHSFVSKFQNSHYVNELEKNLEQDSHYYNISEKEYRYINVNQKSFATSDLRTTNLLLFSLQISNGLCHLAEHNCIHRDLAARNILLTSNLICKISDFGLARFEEPNYYNTEAPVDSDIEAFPQRWMAPESLESNIFSYASDVWSFGIVLFELFSLGKQPYFKFTQDNLRNVIVSGEINEQPDYCHDQIYDLMKRCWSREAQNRPTIKKCHEFLEQHLKEAYPAGLENLDEIVKTEITRQKEIKDLCTPRTYYNT